jgi:hypothetical protein
MIPFTEGSRSPTLLLLPPSLSLSLPLPRQMYQLEEIGVTRSLLEGGIVSMMRVRPPSRPSLSSAHVCHQNKKKVYPIDLPRIPPGSLGSMRNGIQSIPLQVECAQTALSPLRRYKACSERIKSKPLAESRKSSQLGWAQTIDG